MATPSDPHAEVRRELIEAIEAGKWEFTKRALREGGVLSIVVDEDFIRRRPLCSSHRRIPSL
jgi:hypothetical protein